MREMFDKEINNPTIRQKIEWYILCISIIIDGTALGFVILGLPLKLAEFWGIL